MLNEIGFVLVLHYHGNSFDIYIYVIKEKRKHKIQKYDYTRISPYFKH